MTSAAITIEQGTDEETGAAGIWVLYSWTGGASGDGTVELYEDDRLVGRIPFLAGWESPVPMFFRTAPATASHALRAVGMQLDATGRVDPSTVAESAMWSWPVDVAPGQVSS
jgi:hypothetical protein